MGEKAEADSFNAKTQMSLGLKCHKKDTSLLKFSVCCRAAPLDKLRKAVVV